MQLTNVSPSIKIGTVKLALLSALTVGIAAAAPAETLKQYLDSLAGKYEKSIMNKDMAAFKKLIDTHTTKDFKYTEEGQTMGRDQMLAMMGQGFKMMGTMTKSETKRLSLKANETAGTCVEMHIIEYMQKAPGQTKTSLINYTGKSTDSYKKINGKWKLMSMVWSDTKWTMDGKPFNPMAGAAPKQ
jgi:hypothetical protein